MKAALSVDKKESSKAVGSVAWKVDEWADNWGLGKVAVMAGKKVVSSVELKAEMTAGGKVAGLELQSVAV